MKHQSRIELVRTIIDPAPQDFAAGLGKRRLLERAVFEEHHVPAEIAEQVLIALPQTFADDRVEALPVVIDDPPAISQALFPALEHGFENIALVELGIAQKGDHTAFRPLDTPAVGAHIILRQRRKQGLRNAKTDGASRKIDVVGIFGARRIRLRAFIAPEVFELLACLAAEQILDRVKIRRSMRFDRDTILRPQSMEIKRSHNRRERRRRCLVTTDFQPIGVATNMISVVDCPSREPQHFALKLGEYGMILHRAR